MVVRISRSTNVFIRIAVELNLNFPEFDSAENACSNQCLYVFAVGLLSIEQDATELPMLG